MYEPATNLNRDALDCDALDCDALDCDAPREGVFDNDTVRILRALADPNRLAIVDFLRDPIQSCCSRADGVCGCDLEAFLGVSQPTVSHHMKQLIEAGLVLADKRGRWVYYDLNPAAFARVITMLEPYATFVPDTVDTVDTVDTHLDDSLDKVLEGQ